MITGKNHIIAYFASQELPYYAIFYKGRVEKGNAIFRNDKEGEKEYTDVSGRESFEKTLKLLGYGDYTLIMAGQKNVTTRGGARVDFTIGVDENSVTQTQPIAGIATPGLTIDDVNRMADKRFQELMDKREFDEVKKKNIQLERDLRQAEKKLNDPVNVLLSKVVPHTESIISGIMGNKQPGQLNVSGVAPDAVSEADPNDQKIWEDFGEALCQAKPTEWKNILIQLTNLIKTNPTKFETALTFL